MYESRHMPLKTLQTHYEQAFQEQDAHVCRRKEPTGSPACPEGTAAGYIEVKEERPRGVNSYSLGVSQPKSADTRTPSQLLLQLLIDRVEVRKIKYE